jgi:hypothetical protein
VDGWMGRFVDGWVGGQICGWVGKWADVYVVR